MIFCPQVGLTEQVEYIRSLDLPERARVLEAGCGTGPLLRQLAIRNKSWRLTGIDLYVGALARGCMQAAEDRSGIDFLQIDLYDMPFKDASFDLVYTRDVLHHLEDPERATRELKRVLKPNGKLLCFDPAI